MPPPLTVGRPGHPDQPLLILVTMMMNRWIVNMWVVLVVLGASAQAAPWQPAPGHAQIPLWPGAVPDALPGAATIAETTTVEEPLIAGKPYLEIHDVSRPTL